MSSMRSASSRTRISTLSRWAWPCWMWSSRRPGQATRISTPSRRAEVWEAAPTPAVDGGAAQLGAGAQVLDCFVDLFGEFTRGGDDQGARAVARTGQEFIQDGQDEGSRFAGAGLGGADQVIPGQGGREGRHLNGGRLDIAETVDPRLQAWIEVELVEVH